MIKNIVDEDNEGFRKRLEVEKMDEGEDNLEQGDSMTVLLIQSAATSVMRWNCSSHTSGHWAATATILGQLSLALAAAILCQLVGIKGKVWF